VIEVHIYACSVMYVLGCLHSTLTALNPCQYGHNITCRPHHLPLSVVASWIASRCKPSIYWRPYTSEAIQACCFEKAAGVHTFSKLYRLTFTTSQHTHHSFSSHITARLGAYRSLYEEKGNIMTLGIGQQAEIKTKRNVINSPDQRTQHHKRLRSFV
jgi:hypothetical protein